MIGTSERLTNPLASRGNVLRRSTASVAAAGRLTEAGTKRNRAAEVVAAYNAGDDEEPHYAADRETGFRVLRWKMARGLFSSFSYGTAVCVFPAVRPKRQHGRQRMA